MWELKRPLVQELTPNHTTKKEQSQDVTRGSSASQTSPCLVPVMASFFRMMVKIGGTRLVPCKGRWLSPSHTVTPVIAKDRGVSGFPAAELSREDKYLGRLCTKPFRSASVIWVSPLCCEVCRAQVVPVTATRKQSSVRVMTYRGLQSDTEPRRKLLCLLTPPPSPHFSCLIAEELTISGLTA